ncbi:MAG: RES family NAD+ phosphorylase [Hydrococcus sp. RM1_1_31]|nr:RES family NAD+ phosphorylase [Hydrococcus sp. RM1_1_31]
MSLNLWRISKRKYAAGAFNGEGARRFGGRWNSRGRSVIYTSATLSLAALETFVHMEISDAGNLFVYIKAEIPDEIPIEEISASQLPSNWRNLPAPTTLALLGDKWFDEGQTAILVVPSAIIPVENNYLINPLHPDFLKIQIHPPQPFELDPRMWKLS